ncbi:MAG: hypothetical protein LBD21_03180, partial [Tannerellaceae bacterium]|nr:hypothetical protein [Tannerellaceae bacterium]
AKPSDSLNGREDEFFDMSFFCKGRAGSEAVQDALRRMLTVQGRLRAEDKPGSAPGRKKNVRYRIVNAYLTFFIWREL